MIRGVGALLFLAISRMITSLIMCEIHGREDLEDHMSSELPVVVDRCHGSF